ncbi:MAG: insulinase family protein [Candidatus Thioglobus sp.]|nr:insulinase family protein [Candidatus Thioglobus sp.]
MEDLQDWYQQFYAPNNATLVVVGDVNPGEVLALARRYFGEYKSNSNLQKSAKLAIPLKANSKILRLKAKLPLYVLGFHTPSLKTAERPKTAYSLEMLAYVLDNGLAKTLIRNKQIATNISLNYRLYSQFDGLFTLSFTPAEGVSSENVLAEIKKQVAKLINQPHLITAELSRIKAQLEAEFIFQQDQISTQAYYLGTLATVGLGVEELFSYVDKMNEITAAEVIHAAKIYLNFAAANSVELIAEGL